LVQTDEERKAVSARKFMDNKFTDYSFKKFHIVIDDFPEDDDVQLILESNEKNGFGIIFKIKELEIKNLVLDLEIIGKNIENNSFTNDDWSIHYSKILGIEGLDVESQDIPIINFELEHTFLWLPFVNLDELKEFCNIFKQMVSNKFSELDEELKKPEKIARVHRSAEGELYRIDEEYEKQLQERNQNYKQLVKKKAEFEKRQQERKLETEKYFEQVQKSVDNFIQKTSAEEFEEYIIKKTGAIPLYDRINKNTIGMDKVMKDILSETIFADVVDNGISYGRNQMRSTTLTPIQKKYSDIIDDYMGLGRRSKIIHHAQEEATKIILEQLKSHEKVTKTLIKVLLVKNEFTKSMADLVYYRYQESIK
jgi:hypothetical protein